MIPTPIPTPESESESSFDSDSGVGIAPGLVSRANVHVSQKPKVKKKLLEVVSCGIQSSPASCCRQCRSIGSTNNCLILVLKVARIFEFRTNDAPITDRIVRGRHFGKIDDKLSATIVTNFVKTARKLYKTFSMAAVHKLW